MTIYDLWIYKYILNTEWFVWTILIFIFAFNIITPILFWFSITEKKIKFQPMKDIKKITEKQDGSGPS
ncbi:hypothetical protein ACERII_20110 [Evansella sp. AB-rgal1]|uniref:hypothetical protein n=1 Tax=Evansella sp. AB-rgal1 TaxID=3242696 RepID=UPI00359E333D